MSKAIYEEVIEEIGTQTLARLGLNIFSFNTYEAYGSSIRATNDTFRAYDRHKNNPGYYGQTFEELDIGGSNIKDSLYGTGKSTYTTDTLNDIRKAQEFQKSGKKLENLNPKDREKYEYIFANYGDEIENMDFSGELGKYAKSNHNTTDSVTIDKDGKNIKTAQLKVIKDTEGLLKDRYLQGDGAVDELRVPFDDYERHKGNLEKMIADGKDSSDPQTIEKAEKAKIALEKLNQNNLVNCWMSKNPNATATVRQSIVASGHIAQAGLSDAMMVTFSTLASGIIWEIKDMYQQETYSEVSIIDRIKRLFEKVLEEFKKTFLRGASFGAIDTIVGVFGQLFRDFSRTLKHAWKTLRLQVKSIYNAIHSYMTGDIKSFRELLGAILKGLFACIWVGAGIALEKTMEASFMTFFAPLPFVAPLASFLSTLFSIVIASFAVVATSKSIDMTLDSLFAVFASRDMAKMRRDEIVQIIEETLPELVQEEEALRETITKTHQKRICDLDSSFDDYRRASISCDDERVYRALNQINKIWGAELQVKDINDVCQILQNPNRSGKLKWEK